MSETNSKSVLSINIDADTNNLAAKLKAIAKHAAALAEELEQIDKGVCPICGDSLNAKKVYVDGFKMDTCKSCDYISYKSTGNG